jgi:16S rRNA (guanine(966)-N(2))-methyltransferase RsmD
VRIIAGEFRGRRLLPPADAATRPITDRAKQSLFDVLAPRLDEASVADVFAGTGSMGLESLSRGATSCVFYERHRPALERLRRNIDAVGVAERCKIETGDIYRMCDVPAVDVAFLDPPYVHLRQRPADVARLIAAWRSTINPGGVVLVRHDAADDRVDLGPGEVSRRVWGGMTMRWFER